MYQLDYIWVGSTKRSFEKLAKSKRVNKPKLRLGERGRDSHVLPHPEIFPNTGLPKPRNLGRKLRVGRLEKKEAWSSKISFFLNNSGQEESERIYFLLFTSFFKLFEFFIA